MVGGKNLPKDTTRGLMEEKRCLWGAFFARKHQAHLASAVTCSPFSSLVSKIPREDILFSQVVLKQGGTQNKHTHKNSHSLSFTHTHRGRQGQDRGECCFSNSLGIPAENSHPMFYGRFILGRQYLCDVLEPGTPMQMHRSAGGYRILLRPHTHPQPLPMWFVLPSSAAVIVRIIWFVIITLSF